MSAATLIQTIYSDYIILSSYLLVSYGCTEGDLCLAAWRRDSDEGKGGSVPQPDMVRC